MKSSERERTLARHAHNRIPPSIWVIGSVRPSPKGVPQVSVTSPREHGIRHRSHAATAPSTYDFIKSTMVERIDRRSGFLPTRIESLKQVPHGWVRGRVP